MVAEFKMASKEFLIITQYFQKLLFVNLALVFIFFDWKWNFYGKTFLLNVHLEFGRHFEFSYLATLILFFLL
jgi:hypothetical protein